MVQFTKKVARLWLLTSGLIGYTSTRIKSTSSRTSSRGVKCGCKNTTFPIQVRKFMNLNELSVDFYCLLVIWNPWLDKARETPDFGDDEYPNMVCVEAGHVSSPVLLLPGNVHSTMCDRKFLISNFFQAPLLSPPKFFKWLCKFWWRFWSVWPHWHLSLEQFAGIRKDEIQGSPGKIKTKTSRPLKLNSKTSISKYPLRHQRSTCRLILT